MTVQLHLSMLRNLLLILWLLAKFTSAQAEERCSLSVGWDSYGPYLYQNRDGVVTGFDIELMKLLGQEAGCTVTFKRLPWNRHLLELKAGLTDVATSVRNVPEREPYGWLSEPYRESRIAIYVRRGEAGRYPLASLAAIPKTGFKLGIIDSYYYGAEFEALMRDPLFARQVEGSVDYATNIRKLVHGRIDGMLTEDLNVMAAEAEALGLYERLEIYPLTLPSTPVHLLFSKRSVAPATVAAINARLADIKADGRLQQLLDRFVQRQAQ